VGGKTSYGGWEVSSASSLQHDTSLLADSNSGNVSSALISLSYYLATNPKALKLLQEEVDPLLNDGTFNPKQHYPVLNSIMLESFRLQPLVPNGGERVSPPQGLQIGETFIPGNCIIKVPSYTIFRGKFLSYVL
jgi:hypothetical protein